MATENNRIRLTLTSKDFRELVAGRVVCIGANAELALGDIGFLAMMHAIVDASREEKERESLPGRQP